MPLPELLCEISFDPMAQTEEPTWTDVSRRLESWSVDRGRESPLAEYGAGAFSGRFLNHDRALDPSYGRPPGENLIGNPSFETDLTGWSSAGTGSTLARREYPTDGAEPPRQGVAFARATLGMTTNANASCSYALTLPAAGRYLFSAYVRIPTSWTGPAPGIGPLQFLFSATPVASHDADTSIRDRWQRVWRIADITAGDLSGFLAVGAGPHTANGQYLEFDYAEVALLEPTVTSIPDPPYYPNVKINRRLRLREGWRNLVANPVCYEDDSGWFADGGNSTIDRTTDEAKIGPASLLVEAVAAGNFGCGTTAALSGSTAGRRLVAAFDVLAVGDTVGRTVEVIGQEEGGAAGASDTRAEHVLTAGWQRVHHVHTVTEDDRNLLRAYLRVLDADAGGERVFVGSCLIGEYDWAPPVIYDPRSDIVGLAYQFCGYIDAKPQQWPAGPPMCDISAKDGTRPLTSRRLPTTNPPASSYADVVLSDITGGEQDVPVPTRQRGPRRTPPQTRRVRVGAWGCYHRLGELEGEKYADAAGNGEMLQNDVDLDPTLFPPPTLGAPGLVIGDTDTALLIASSTRNIQVPMEMWDVYRRARLTFHALVHVTALSNGLIAEGPRVSGVANFQWGLALTSAGAVTGFVRTAASGGTTWTVTSSNGVIATNTSYHVAIVWSVSALRILVNGVEVASRTDITGSAVAATGTGSAASLLIGRIDELAFVATDLSTTRIGQLYEAALVRGFPEQLSSDRIDTLLDLAGWPAGDRNIQTGQRNVQPARQYAQPYIDELRKTAEAEWPGRFFFDAAGRPTFLDRDWATRWPYNTPQHEIADAAGNVRYEKGGGTVDDDSWLYNVVRTMRRGGPVQEARDADSVTEYGEMLHDQFSDLTVTTDAAAQEIRDAVLARFKEPLERLESIEIRLDPEHDDTARAVLTADLCDRVLVRRFADTASPLVQDSHIERISHRGGPKGRRSVVYSLSPR